MTQAEIEQKVIEEPRDAWWMLFILLALYVLAFMDRMSMIMLVRPLKESLGLSDFQVSLLMGPAFAISYGLFGFLFGWLTDRQSRRRIVYFGATAWSLMTMVCGLAGGFWTLFAARVGVGTAESCLTPAAYSLIADKFPRERLTTALSIYAMGPKTGQAVAFYLGAAAIALATTIASHEVPLIGHMEAWQVVFLLLGLPGVFVALLVWTFKEPPRKTSAVSQAAGQDNLAAFLKACWPLLALLLTGYTLVTIVNGGVVNWSPTYMERRFGWTVVQYGPALGTISLLAAATLPGSGLVVDHFYRQGLKDAHTRVYTWLLAAVLPVIACFSIIPNPFLFLIAYGIIQAVVMSFMLYVSATIPMIAPAQLRGRITAIFLFSFTLIGSSIGPSTTAAVTDFIFRDPNMVGHSIALVGVTGCLLALLALRVALRPLRAAIDANEGF